jgi:hypothetical protein
MQQQDKDNTMKTTFETREGGQVIIEATQTKTGLDFTATFKDTYRPLEPVAFLQVTTIADSFEFFAAVVKQLATAGDTLHIDSLQENIAKSFARWEMSTGRNPLQSILDALNPESMARMGKLSGEILAGLEEYGDNPETEKVVKDLMRQGAKLGNLAAVKTNCLPQELTDRWLEEVRAEKEPEEGLPEKLMTPRQKLEAYKADFLREIDALDAANKAQDLCAGGAINSLPGLKAKELGLTSEQLKSKEIDKRPSILVTPRVEKGAFHTSTEDVVVGPDGYFASRHGETKAQTAEILRKAADQLDPPDEKYKNQILVEASDDVRFYRLSSPQGSLPDGYANILKRVVEQIDLGLFEGCFPGADCISDVTKEEIEAEEKRIAEAVALSEKIEAENNQLRAELAANLEQLFVPLESTESAVVKICDGAYLLNHGAKQIPSGFAISVGTSPTVYFNPLTHTVEDVMRELSKAGAWRSSDRMDEKTRIALQMVTEEAKRRAEIVVATPGPQGVQGPIGCPTDRPAEAFGKLIDGGPWEKADKTKAYESLAADVITTLGGEPGLRSIASYKDGHHNTIYGGSPFDDMPLPEFIELATKRASENLGRSIDVATSFVATSPLGGIAYVIIDGMLVAQFNKPCE